MKIPKRFKVFGMTVEVTYSDALFKKDESFGVCSYRDNEITLQTGQKEDQELQTFCHELMHMIVYHAQDDSMCIDGKWLHQNECFVDKCGSLLAQFITTKEDE